MARLTNSDAIGNIESQFGIFGECLNMMSNKNFPFIKPAFLASEMVTFKHMPSPLLHFKRVAGLLIHGADATIPARVVFTPEGVSLRAVADVEPLFGSIYPPVWSHPQPSLFGDYNPGLGGMMFAFNRWGHTFVCSTNCILNRLRACLPVIRVAGTGYSKRYARLGFLCVGFPIKRICHTFITRLTELCQPLQVSPLLSFNWVFRCWHNLLSPQSIIIQGAI